MYNFVCVQDIAWVLLFLHHFFYKPLLKNIKCNEHKFVKTSSIFHYKKKCTEYKCFENPVYYVLAAYATISLRVMFKKLVKNKYAAKNKLYMNRIPIKIYIYMYTHTHTHTQQFYVKIICNLFLRVVCN